ncbi:methyltransferase domain-containing protein [Flavisolibacter nicotianae]|uniref:SAM-dependent methyltransferase n=1 Tax=Flavisolibacter nicotianae TaxID=2364882 RepID=UPI000EAB4F32|nr:SAM-dependent methyltransferase [Flavisolibacter nicotianae]
MVPFQPHPSSYRDPSGFLFWHEGTLYRQVNRSFGKAFDQFHSGGLSAHLVSKGILTPYEPVNRNLTGSSDWHQTLKPAFLPFISYPYEWSFDMLKDAALTTLEAAREAIAYRMHLKDASAYNVQLHKGRMQFIDTLSFEPYNEQKPWVAYRQFCEHFLAPLALMHYLKEPLQPLQLAWPDGIPLPLTKKFLPGRSRWNLHVYLNLHLQANLSQKAVGNPEKQVRFSKSKMLQLLKSLRTAVNSFHLDSPSGVWSAYYEEAMQRDDYVQQKKKIIEEWLPGLTVNSAVDVGANEGEFSFLLAEKGIRTISADFDHFSINNLYKKMKQRNVGNLYPLLVDLGNPSPAIGVNNQERASFLERAGSDLVLALAVIHHLAIGKNIDFEKIATFFASLGKTLLLEFVPKEDEKVQLMLRHKPDVYDWYSRENFLHSFSTRFDLVREEAIGSSGRSLLLFKAR